jgi:hypothetical protein
MKIAQKYILALIFTLVILNDVASIQNKNIKTKNTNESIPQMKYISKFIFKIYIRT